MPTIRPRKHAGEPSTDILYKAFYQLALCERVGPLSSYGADVTGQQGPYESLAAYAAGGALLNHPLVMDALLARLPRFRTQPSQIGDLNWEVRLPELLLSCPVLFPSHLQSIDAAAVDNAELRWMRRKVAEHPSRNIDVLEVMARNGIDDDVDLARLVDEQLKELRALRALDEYRLARRQRAKQRLCDYLEAIDPVAYAISRYLDGGTTLDQTLD